MPNHEETDAAQPKNPTAALDLFETNTHSFVLRIWREEAITSGENELWRGHITHVQGGQRRYFQHLGEIVAFIATFLPTIHQFSGQPLSFSSRLQRWFCRRLHCANGEQS